MSSTGSLVLAPHTEVRRTWLGCLDALAATVEGYRERELLEPSRCLGWARLDLCAHLVAGLEEMLHGVTAPVDQAPGTDAATYWDDFAPADPDADETFAGILPGRRLGSAPSRPEGVRRQLRVVVEAVRRATAGLDDRARLFQGGVLSTTDFLGIWVVEIVSTTSTWTRPEPLRRHPPMRWR